MSRKLFGVILAAVVTVATGGFGGTLGKFATGLGSKFGLSGLAANKFGSFLIRAGLGLALAAQQPKLPSKGYTVNQKGSNLDHQIIYGKTKVGGAIVFDTTTGSSNKYLHRVIAVAGHEVNSFEEIWLNDYKLTLDANGEVTSATNDGGSTTTTRYNGYVRVKTKTGTDTQAAEGTLVSEVTDWTSAHRLRGIAYMYVRLKFDADVFPNGVPEIQAVVKGKKVYDPRTSTTAWSDNPALCIRDYLVSSYGLNAETSEIDDDLVNEAANYCDTTASNNDNFFTMNGSFTTGSQPIDILNDMLTSMCGVLWYSQGVWRMRAAPAKISSSDFDDLVTLTLDEDDLRGPMEVNTRHSRRDNFNVIKGTWRGEDSEWQDTDYPEYKVAQAVTDDGGEESIFDMPLNFTDNSAEAERIARIVYERNRQQLTVSGTFGLKAMKCQVGDFIQLDNARMGWTSKYFEVTEWSFGMDGMDLAINMVLREISYDVFDEVSSYTTLDNDNTTLASPFDVQAVTASDPTASSSLNEDGTVVPKIQFAWSVTDTSDVAHYIFGYRVGASGTYNEVVVNAQQYEIEPAVAGATYYYFIQSVNHQGIKSSSSAAAASGTVDAVGDSTAPSAPTGLAATGGHKLIELNWTNPTDADFRHVKIQVSTDNSTWSDLGFSSSTRFVHAGLGDEVQRYYRIRAEDFSDNASSYTSSENATTLVSPKGDDGDRGAGQFRIELSTANMPAVDASSSTINTKFTDTTNGVGVSPVERDQAWFTDTSTQEQRVWVYDGTDWNYQSVVIDGNLIVDGTINADKVNVDKLDALSATLGVVEIEDTLRLTAGGSGFLGGRDASSDYAEDGFFIARTKTGTGADDLGYEVSFTSEYDDGGTDRLSGVIATSGAQTKVINPLFYSGGTTDGGTTDITPASSDAFDDIGNVDEVTVTAYGGGGAGGFGCEDGSGSGRGGSGGTTTVTVRRGSSTGTVLATITAGGGQGGLNGSGVGTGSGTDGQSSDFGVGGTGGSRNNTGSPQSATGNTNWGSGGGGAGGDAAGFLDPQSGQAGQGGSAGAVVTQTIDLSAETQNTFIVVDTFGTAGVPSALSGNGSYLGGYGARGAAKYTSVLGGTTQYEIADLVSGYKYHAGHDVSGSGSGTGISTVVTDVEAGDLFLLAGISGVNNLTGTSGGGYKSTDANVTLSISKFSGENAGAQFIQLRKVDS